MLPGTWVPGAEDQGSSLSSAASQPNWTRYHDYVVHYEGTPSAMVMEDVPRLERIGAPRANNTPAGSPDSRSPDTAPDTEVSQSRLCVSDMRLHG
jgi:hypothetical protein